VLEGMGGDGRGGGGIVAPAAPALLHRAPVQTVRFKSELVRNITIKLGYANAKIYRSDEVPHSYESRGSSTPDVYVGEDG